VLGYLVLFANFILVIGAIYAARFVYLQDLERMKRRERKVAKIEYAVQYDDDTFASMLEDINETSLLLSTILVYHYTSIAAAKYFVKTASLCTTRTNTTAGQPPIWRRTKVWYSL